MFQVDEQIKSWDQIESIADIFDLIDYGVVLDWANGKRIKKNYSNEDINEIICYIVHRLSERYENQLSCELLLETLFVILHIAEDEAFVYRCISATMNLSNNFQCIDAMVKVAFKIDFTNSEKSDELFSTAVFFISEIGIVLWKYFEENPESEKDVTNSIDSITAHLLSITNENNPYVRVCLFRYFGVFNAISKYRDNFNRALGRFGHTVLEQLFIQLLSKKNEGIALDYLLANVPYVLESNSYGQQILHANFRHFLLKRPERFMVFLQRLSHTILSEQNARYSSVKKQLLQHYCALFAVSNELNHKELGREIVILIMSILEQYDGKNIVMQLLSEVPLKPAFKELAFSLTSAQNNNEFMKSIKRFKSSKRGRKPSFSKGIESTSLTLMRRLGESILKTG